MAVTTTDTGAPGMSEGVRVLGAAFVENGAGTYGAEFQIPAGATILDIQVDGDALWTAGTSASLEIGDATDPDGFFTAVDLKAVDLLAGEGLSFAKGGGAEGAYFQVAATHGPKALYSDSPRVITATVVAAGTDGTAGRTKVRVLFSVNGYVTITQ